MTRLLLTAVAFLLTSCGASVSTPVDVGSARTAATMSLNGTSWEFDDDGVPTIITIDAAGAYIENRVSGQHVVDGTYRQVGGKDCFTSAMGDRKVSCWTAVPPTAVGQTATATSDNGSTATFKRVAYRVLRIAD